MDHHASKFAKDKKDGAAIKDVSGATRPVRMSFKTEKPFFPYREPADQRNDIRSFRQTRLLRIFYISNTPAKATIGGNVEKVDGHHVAANAQHKYRDDMLHLLKLPNNTGPTSWWVTVFEDRSSPRPGLDEVYFAPDGDARQPEASEFARVDVHEGASIYTIMAFLLAPGLVLVLPRLHLPGRP